MAKQWFVAVPKDGAFSVAVEGLLEHKYPIYLPYVYDRVTEGRKIRCEQELRPSKAHRGHRLPVAEGC